MRYDVKKLKDTEKQAEFQLELRNRFTSIQKIEEADISIENYWKMVKTSLTSACETPVGLKTRKHKEWISQETLKEKNGKK